MCLDTTKNLLHDTTATIFRSTSVHTSLQQQKFVGLVPIVKEGGLSGVSL